MTSFRRVVGSIQLKALPVQRATADDIDSIILLISDLSQWLKTKGIHQWTNSYPREILEKEIESGEVFVSREQTEIIAMVTLTTKMDPGSSTTSGTIWTSHCLKKE